MDFSDKENARNVPIKAECDNELLHVALKDGRKISVPLWWHPVLLNASQTERSKIELLPLSLHWPDLDEDISIKSMLLGRKSPGAVEPELEAAE